MIDQFQPQVNVFTVVCNSNGEEIDRLDGIVTIKPTDYDQYMPITYSHISVTTEVLKKAKIERP